MLHHSGEYRWLRLKASPKLDENGRVVRWYGTSTDIHLEKSISLERELVAHELDHRIKNLFALVNGLVGLSARESPELKPVLRPYCGGNGVFAATLDGDDTSIDSGQITPYALLIHELATNSLKYGALAADDGRLSIHICQAGQTMWLRWMEQAAAIPAQRGSHNGYGSTLLKLTVEKQLSGQIRRRQGKGYLCYLLTIPMPLRQFSGRP